MLELRRAGIINVILNAFLKSKWKAECLASIGLLACVLLNISFVHAARLNTVNDVDTSLNFISFTALDDGGVELHLTFSSPPPQPKSTTTANPASLALEFHKVINNLPWSLPLPIDVGAAGAVTAIETNGRTRVIVSLKQMVSYETRKQGNSVFVTIGEDKTVISPMAIPAKEPARAMKVANVDSSKAGSMQSNSIELEDISFTPLSEDRARITLKFSGKAPKPGSFTIDDPARIAFDFPNTTNRLPWRTRNIGIGMAKSITAVSAGGRTRVVLNLVKLLPYETRVEGNIVYVTLKGDLAQAKKADPDIVKEDSPFSVKNVDFRRGENGEGRVIVTLSHANISVDTRKVGNKVVVSFDNVKLPDALHQRIDVVDFATPVQFIDVTAADSDVNMTISPTGLYEYLAFQSDNTFTIEIKRVSKVKKDSQEAIAGKFTGEQLSLNFQDIEVRAVLQLLADFTGLNMVSSDTVQGNLTLRLKNVPWDQALDIILKTKGLAMRKSGNVIMIAPTEEIAAREKLELEAQKQNEDLSPLQSELIQINYAKATELAALLQSQDNTLLSERGKISVDERTNTLLVLETDERLENIRSLISKLDVAVRQVLIETRIVVANNDFAKDLGVRFGVSGVREGNSQLLLSTGTIEGTDTMFGSATDNLASTGQIGPIGLPAGEDLPQRLNVNFPVGGTAGGIAFAILGSNTLLDLELSALQAEGKGEVISSPRVITSNQSEAVIKQGTQIPFQQASSSGATAIQFKEAVLSLTVTPHITPDDRILMDLHVTKDSVGQVVPTAEGGETPSIDTRSIKTQVLVQSGQTVVLGGIHEQERRNTMNKIPFFGDLPFLGALFRSTRELDNNSELLIFVTPKILKDTVTLR